jgi:hypothetical protein
MTAAASPTHTPPTYTHVRTHCHTGSRKNIEEHYDAGNAMYAAFLDGSMTYSCGIHTREQGGDLKVCGVCVAGWVAGWLGGWVGG